MDKIFVYKYLTQADQILYQENSLLDKRFITTLIHWIRLRRFFHCRKTLPYKGVVFLWNFTNDTLKPSTSWQEFCTNLCILNYPSMDAILLCSFVSSFLQAELSLLWDSHYSTLNLSTEVFCRVVFCFSLFLLLINDLSKTSCSIHSSDNESTLHYSTKITGLKLWCYRIFKLWTCYYWMEQKKINFSIC